MTLRNILQKLLLLSPSIFVFIASLYQPNDPDLGWHLKYGEYFFNHHSILLTNTFTTDMASFRWVNISWGTDILTYLFYHLGGFFGLSLAGAGVITATFYFFSRAFRLDFFEELLIFPFILYVQNSLITVSFRGQLISILFLGILTYILRRYEEGKGRRLYFFLPILFLVWANIHGQFIIGLGMFALWTVSYLLQKLVLEKDKKETVSALMRFGILFVVSALATLINPFGIGIYKETLNYVGNPLLMAVLEYVPPPQFSQVWWNHILTGFLCLIGIVGIIMSGKWKQKISDLTAFGVLYTMAFMVKRYSWSMYYFTIPFLKPLASFIKPDSKRNTQIAGSILAVILIGFAIFMKQPFSQLTNMSWDIFCHDYYACSAKGADVLRSLDNPGRIMNLYAWGGWLDWEYPEIKTSIDGRMHLWKDEKGFSAYKTYYDYEQDVKNVDDSTYDTVYISKDKPVYNRLVQLALEKKWVKKYEDDMSAIYVRAKPAI